MNFMIKLQNSDAMISNSKIKINELDLSILWIHNHIQLTLSWGTFGMYVELGDRYIRWPQKAFDIVNYVIKYS